MRMPVEIHMICHERLNVSNETPTHFDSGWWRVSSIWTTTGIVFALHERKKLDSYLQGIIEEELDRGPGGDVLFRIRRTHDPLPWRGTGTGESGYVWREVTLEESDRNAIASLSPEKRERLTEAFLRKSRLVADLKRMYGGRCQICGESPFAGTLGPDVLEAHHIRWLCRGGEDQLSNMVLLCPNHHAAIHSEDPDFDRRRLQFRFPNGSVSVLRLDKHLKTM